MPLYDIDRAGAEMDSASFYQKYVQPVAARLDSRTFEKMVRTVDGELAKLRPSQKSQLTWTRCAALCGYQSDAPTASTNHLWDAAVKASPFDPDGPNLFVGSLIMWRISLLGDTWLSSKTKDAGGVHPYRAYWINNSFIPYRQNTLSDLMEKFGGLTLH